MKSVSPTGSARKVSITIVIAYKYPNLQNDFDTFCTKYGLPKYTLNIISLGTKNDDGWAQEECLDVQWAYAMNPNADIRVIEAATSGFYDLLNAVKYASDETKGKTDIISMSWGADEFNGENRYDSYFSNPNICYLASSGDSNTCSWPSISPNVLACGGTTLNTTNSTKRISETTWTSAGCGISQYYSQPGYQQNVSGLTKYKNRTIPDISAVANPQTGVSIVYNGVVQKNIGGTSVSCPVLAGMLSIGIQKRLNANKYSLTTAPSKSSVRQINLLQQLLYKTIYGNSTSYKQTFYDVTTGKNGNYTSGGGIDMPTGLGVPYSDVLSQSIVNM